MNTNNTFNLQRLTHLMMNDVRLQAKTILIVTAIIVLLFTLFSFNYFFILYVGGFIVTSAAFNDLHDRSKAHLFLMLPCSNLERFLSKWLLTSIGYALGTLIIYYLCSLFSVIIHIVAFKEHTTPVNILQPTLWIGIAKYLILQSAILLSAITFKKQALIKAALIIGSFILVLGGFLLLLAQEQGMLIVQNILEGANYILWIILAPFCLYITYLKLTEYELK